MSRSGLGTFRGRIAVLGGAIVCLLAAGIAVVVTHAAANVTGTGKKGHLAVTDHVPAVPLRVKSITPAAGSAGVNGGADVRVTFSAPLADGSPMPALHPAIAGSWQRVGNAVVFTPQRGFGQHAHVRLTIPGGPSGVRSAGGHLAATGTASFDTGGYSRMRMDQLLAQLGYLPLTWTPVSGSAAPVSGSAAQAAGAAPAAGGSGPAAGDLAAQASAAFAPPAGTFSWKPGYPTRLHYFWQGGGPGSLIIQGAVMAFQSQHNMTLTGTASPQLWKALLRAAASNQRNPYGYTYAVASQHIPETLTIWHNGHVVLHSLANTGISVAPSAIATNPVYVRYRFQIMRGTNPGGSTYADPVEFVAYFHGGEAVHYFPRGSYGYPQSLGCVELPLPQAAKAWPYLTYGSLVTVTAP